MSHRQPHEPLPPADYHTYDRALLPAPSVEEASGTCVGCHRRAPHRARRETRAFLNYHAQTLDCGVCHLQGRQLVVRRFRGDSVVTAASLTTGEGGMLYAAQRVGSDWEKVRAPGPDSRFVAAGPECRTCHRRGSPLLAVEGLFDGHRRLLLEDLAVLHRLEGGRR